MRPPYGATLSVVARPSVCPKPAISRNMKAVENTTLAET